MMNTNYFLHDYYIILHLNREKRIDIIIDRTIALATREEGATRRINSQPIFR